MLKESSTVKVIVLTLERAKDRQQRIKALLDEASIPFGFFWGVDGQQGQNPVEILYDEKLRVRVKGAPLSRGQLGCYASHYNIWQMCVKGNHRLVVLEDDATFDTSLFKAFLNSVGELPQEAGCIRLFDNKTRNHKAFQYAQCGKFKLLRYTKGPMSTMGYYLTPGGAERFLAHSQPVFLPVDIYMDRYWSNGVLCCGLEPAFVFNDRHFESMIGYEKKTARRSLLVTLFRESFTLSERLRRYFYNRKFN